MAPGTGWPARLSSQLPTKTVGLTRRLVSLSDVARPARHPGRPTPSPRPGCRGFPEATLRRPPIRTGVGYALRNHEGACAIDLSRAGGRRVAGAEGSSHIADEGPSLDCYRSGEAIVAQALEGGFDQWPRFARACVDPGFSSVIAVPLRVTGKVIGALNLFGTDEQPARDVATARVAQAMAHVAATTPRQATEPHRSQDVIRTEQAVAPSV